MAAGLEVSQQTNNNIQKVKKEIIIQKAEWFEEALRLQTANYVRTESVIHIHDTVANPLSSGYEWVMFRVLPPGANKFEIHPHEAFIVQFDRSIWKSEAHLSHRKVSVRCRATYLSPSGDRWPIPYANIVPMAKRIGAGTRLEPRLFSKP